VVQSVRLEEVSGDFPCHPLPASPHTPFEKNLPMYDVPADALPEVIVTSPCVTQERTL